jgi:predicted nucleic acid-binding Zn ribbon protein
MTKLFPNKFHVRFKGEGFYVNDARVAQGDAGKPMTNFSGLEDGYDPNA